MRKNRYVSYYDASIDDETLDNELATDKTDGLMSKEDKAKLDRLNENGTFDAIVNAKDVIEDSENRFVTDEQIAKWDNNTSSLETEYDEEEEALIILI